MNFAPYQVNIASGTAPSSAARSVYRSPHPIATGILLLYLFLVVSRGVEMLTRVAGVNLHLTLTLMLVALLAAIFTGGMLEAVKTPVVLLFTAFTGWFLITTLTSQWRGGSVMTLVNYWIPSYGCVILVPSLISSLDQCRKACYVLAFSLVPMLLATVLFPSQVQGRDQALFGSLENPNDLAFSLLLLIPFAVFVIKSESLRSWKGIACLLAILFAMLKTLKTGSRAAMITLAVCFVILFLAGKMKTKLKMVGLLGLMVVFAVATVPSQIFQRYATIFRGTSSDDAMSVDELSAVESAQARKMLLGESVSMMLTYPVFGVGPGIFQAALAGEQKERGVQQSWHEAHNSYTQIGSEMGFPAFIIYVAVLLYSMKRAVSIYRRARKDPAQVAICSMAASLSMALVIYAVSATFGNYSYSFHFPILAGLVQAFDVCVRKGMNTTPSIAPAGLHPRAIASTPNPQVPTYVRNRRLRHDRA